MTQSRFSSSYDSRKTAFSANVQKVNHTYRAYGFSVLEILVVLAVIGIMASLGVIFMDYFAKTPH